MKPLVALIASGMSSIAIAGAGSMAYSTKELSDDVRASIAKEMSKAKQFKNDRKDDNGTESDDDSSSGRSSNSCQMDVGSSEKTRAGQRASSRNVTVVQGNVIQICSK